MIRPAQASRRRQDDEDDSDRLRRCARGGLLTAVAPPRSSASRNAGLVHDREKQWTAKATVTEFRYLNPHAQIYFDVDDAKGRVTPWSGELFPNPAQLIATGWTRKRATEALKAGTPMNITVAPATGRWRRRARPANRQTSGQELLGARSVPGAPGRAPRP